MSLTLDHLSADTSRAHLTGNQLLLVEQVLVGVVRHSDVLNVLLLGSTALP